MAQEAQKGDRIALTAMEFDPNEPLIATLVKALKSAAAREVKVYLSIDAMSFMRSTASGLGIFWHKQTISASLPDPYGSRFKVIESLRQQGCQVGITNVPTKQISLIPAGRSHIKAAVFNDQVYIGGCNLDKPDQVDIMTSWHDQTAADWVFETITAMATQQNTQYIFNGEDRLLNITTNSTLLIDAGKPKQSVIYDHALRLIDEAQQYVTITCQYFPGGRTAEHLLAAQKRGVIVTILFSHPTAHEELTIPHSINQFWERMRFPANFFALRLSRNVPKLHAKVLATDQGVMIGSHNYVGAGVRLGTAEIALLHRNAALGLEMLEKINKEIQNYKTA